MKNENNLDKLPEGFLEHLSKTKDAIQQIELEEYRDRLETEDAIKNRIVAEVESTNKQKKRFIDEIKSGLGQEIKKDPSKIEVIKRPWYTKIGKFFKKIFKTI